MPFPTLVPRLKATFIHLLVTLAVAGLAWGLMRFVWFPGDYIRLMEGVKLLMLVAGCDLVLGPLMSLVIYNPAKARRLLVLDYAVVGAIQLGALAYGLSVVAVSRPAFTVLEPDTLEVVTAIEAGATTAATRHGWTAAPVSWWGPRLVLLRPIDAKERAATLDAEFQGQALGALLQFQLPWQGAEALKRAQPLAALYAKHPEARARVEAALGAGASTDGWRWLPAKTRYGFHTALLDAAGQPRHFIAVDPY